MPLQNRVSPFGELVVDPARGVFMGNRGGRIHDDAQKLTTRRWASRQWICCRLDFNGRQREVWGGSYTELFFLDEVTALAAGHRPCFECRRADALAFATAWAKAFATRPRAAEIDAALHAERLAGRHKRTHIRSLASLPDGTVVVLNGQAHAVRKGQLLLWSFSGYRGRSHRVDRPVEVLTPPSIIAALAAGYRPQWHVSAGR